MKKTKRFSLGLSILALSLTLSACGGEQVKLTNDDGTAIHYKEEDMPEGLFIKDKENYFQLLNVPRSSERNFIWFTGYDKAIPLFTKGDSLVLYSNNVIPEELTFWKLTDFEYTVGVKFARADDRGGLTFPSSSEDYNPYSPVMEYMTKDILPNGTRNVVIKEVNGKEFKETMLSVDGFMKGLTKDAMYKFYYYEGTVYKDVNIKADTHVFLEDYSLTTSSFTELKDKTFEVNIPTGIEDGFWYIDGYGMFEFRADENALIKDSNEEKEKRKKKNKEDEEEFEEDIEVEDEEEFEEDLDSEEDSEYDDEYDDEEDNG